MNTHPAPPAGEQLLALADAVRRIGRGLTPTAQDAELEQMRRQLTEADLRAGLLRRQVEDLAQERDAERTEREAVSTDLATVIAERTAAERQLADLRASLADSGSRS